MKTIFRSALFLFPFWFLMFVHLIHETGAQPVLNSPTPTYDPLVEPPLPDNPTEYELGRNLYWHWCMTCHGDRGQGLTDEFRGIWEPEHQNCWGRGCHAGHSGDGGFPIPTVVPVLVDETHLAKFAAVQELSDFLKGTHPPQSPGILKNEEYHAIALFVFAMNERSLLTIPVTETPAPVPTRTRNLNPPQDSRADAFPISVVVILAVLLVVTFALIRTGKPEHPL